MGDRPAVGSRWQRGPGHTDTVLTLKQDDYGDQIWWVQFQTTRDGTPIITWGETPLSSFHLVRTPAGDDNEQ